MVKNKFWAAIVAANMVAGSAMAADGTSDAKPERSLRVKDKDSKACQAAKLATDELGEAVVKSAQNTARKIAQAAREIINTESYGAIVSGKPSSLLGEAKSLNLQSTEFGRLVKNEKLLCGNENNCDGISTKLTDRVFKLSTLLTELAGAWRFGNVELIIDRLGKMYTISEEYNDFMEDWRKKNPEDKCPRDNGVGFDDITRGIFSNNEAAYSNNKSNIAKPENTDPRVLLVPGLGRGVGAAKGMPAPAQISP